MVERIAEIEIGAGQPCDDSLLEWLQECLESGTRVVLLNLPEGSGDEGLSAAGLASMLAFELPIVVAFEGALRGPRADLVLAADIRVSAHGSSLQGRLAGNARVRTLTDEGTALDLYFGAKPIASDALFEAGVISALAEAGGALAEGRRVAETIASRGPIAVRLAKEAIWRGLAQPLPPALRFETDLTLLLQTTKDRAEGVRAFLEKRPPIFTGE